MLFLLKKNGAKTMRTVTFLKPVVDLKATENQIKSLRIESVLIENALKKISKTWSNFLAFTIMPAVRSIAASRLAQNIPRMFCRLKPSLPMFETTIEQIVISRMVEVEISCNSDKVEKLCNKNCDACNFKLSA